MIVTLWTGSDPGEQLGDERVAGLVVGGGPLLALGDDHRLALGAHEDLVLGHLEVAHVDLVLVLARGEQRRLVDQVLEVGAGEARRAAAMIVEVDVRSTSGTLLGVDLAGCPRGP